MWGIKRNTGDVLRHAWASVVILMFVLLLAGRSNGQSLDPVHVAVAPDSSGPLLRPKPLRHDVDLVLVPVTVTDRFNSLVTDLQKQDFRLLDGEKPQDIRYFSAEDAPISLGVILDLSASMKDKIDDAREAVIEFFKSSNAADDYFVITFSSHPRVLADSTRSIGYIRDKLATVEPQGQTALFDAIYLGINKMRQARYGRRALLVISDGGDNCSRFTERELKKLTEESDVQIYSIGIFNPIMKLLLPPEERHGKQLLTDVSAVTGGRMIELKSTSDLPAIAREVGIELRNQYVLGYLPHIESRDGKWRKINVSLVSPEKKAEWRVHSKRGYLAPDDEKR